MMNLELTGADVVRIRESTSLSQPAFGQALGVSEKTVRNWETGGTIPVLAQLLLSGIEAAVNHSAGRWAAELQARLGLGQ